METTFNIQKDQE